MFNCAVNYTVIASDIFNLSNDSNQMTKVHATPVMPSRGQHPKFKGIPIEHNKQFVALVVKRNQKVL